MDQSTAPASKPSSGRIISHNIHLLNDSYDDQETGSLPSQQKPEGDGLHQENLPPAGSRAMALDNSMGGELPGVEQPDVGDRYSEQFRDSLDERPASNSSADSRGMDDSPIDENPVNSQDSLKVEKQYQDDLKERVRQSFKDLGMEPEGILRDSLEEPSKSGKRKKRKPTSNTEANTTGDSGEDEPSDDGNEPTSDVPANPASYADEPSRHATEPSDSADDRAAPADEPTGYSDEPAGYADEPAGYSDEAAGYADEHPGYADEPSGYADEQKSYSKDPEQHSEPFLGSDEPAASGYANQVGVYEDQAAPKGFPGDKEQDEGNDDLVRTYPNKGEVPTPHGYHSGGLGNAKAPNNYPGDLEYGSNKELDAVVPNRQPEEISGEEINVAPGNYPKDDQYEDAEYGHHPGQGNHRGGDHYPERDSYPHEGGYAEDAGYANDHSYPDQGSGSFPQGGNYPQGNAYEDRAPYENAYTPEGDASDNPKERTPVSSSYPSRYDNQDYADDEEQYGDSGQIPYGQQSSEPYDQTLKDSLDYGQPTGNSNDTVPTDSLDYDRSGDAARNSASQGLPDTQSGNYAQDSLDFGYPEQASDTVHANDTGKRNDIQSSGDADAPYDSLDEDEPYSVPNNILPQRNGESGEAQGPNDNNLQGEWPRNQEPFAVSELQSDVSERSGGSSNKSSANSVRAIPNSFESEKPLVSQTSPHAQGSPGSQNRPPQGRRKTPSRSGSRGLGSRGSSRPSYSELARQRGSVNQKGSAGSNQSSKSRSPEQGDSVSANQNRARSLSNRIKTTPIPADELSAKEFLKRTRSKSDATVERPKVEHSNSQIIKKNGEEVRVAYISDDSGDEGEHFLDDKGSPVDHFGKPLYKDLHGTSKKAEEPKLEYRIKPVPPKQKSPLELQIVNARRTSADAGNKTPHGGKITIARPFQVEEPLLKKEETNQTGLLDDALPPQKNTPKMIEEPVTHKSIAQQEGISESTQTPQLQDRSTQKEETDSPSGSASKTRAPFGEVRLRSVGTIMSGKSMGRGRTPPVLDNKGEDPYRDLRFERDDAQKHGRDNKSAIDRAVNKDIEAEKSSVNASPPPKTKIPLSSTYRKEDFDKPDDYPAGSRGASGASLQDRGIQYTPQTDQDRQQPSLSQPYSRPDPAIQQPVQHQEEYNNPHPFYPNANSQDAFNPQQGFPAPAQQPPIQHNADQHFMQQSWEQQMPSVPWNNTYPPQVPQQLYNSNQPVQNDPQQGGHNPQGGYYNQQYVGYSAPQQNQTQYYDQQQPPDAGYQTYPGGAPQQGRPAGPQDYIASQPPNRPYPNQGARPAPGYYPNPSLPGQNEPPRQRAPPKPKPNFIDLNKSNLTRGPPRRKYSEMQKKVPTPTRINPKKPLPDISRESSQYEDPLAENGHNLGSAQTWAHEDWTRQLIQDQQNLPLRRGHSDTNLYIQNQGPGTIPQGYQPQGATSVPGYSNDAGPGYMQDPRTFQPAYNQTYPPQVPRNLNGQPYSYSADHATQFARNNGFARPQLSGPPGTKVAFADDFRNSFDSDINPMVYANEMTGPGYHHLTKRTSPYNVLPDIPGHPDPDGTSPLRKSDPDGYMARLLKQKQPPQYKEYTLKDYRNLKNDIRLGGLGPDPELISEKQEKVNRQRDYAKSVMQQNKKQLQQSKRLWPKQAESPKDATPSKRDIAIEYSKTVPKPRMPTPPEVWHERMFGASSRQQAKEEVEHEERAASEMARLEELRARHEKEKEEVERLRTEVLS
ncbi:uncharacterized protein LOC110983012 isoform X2 [Acanthaster planci]|uniref:Uncharacterized protein LOC110983012 isoform X2 n=1 Tax=Acanthaster planci TaxID=133434 RepID=A0A8B7YXZ0_ACAPL|nr:uncharacterized protein LOC110983012 isoform X2 [Acanthaster planci]